MSHSPEQLHYLLTSVASGSVSPDEALQKLKYLSYEPVDDFARIDHHRSLRTGFPEVIWGPGKTPDQIVRIMETMRSQHPYVLATRIEPDVYDAIKDRVPNLHYFANPKLCALAAPPEAPTRLGTIGLLSAGTADLPVAEEAALVATYCGFHVIRFWDVGVAGIHRLLNNREAIAQADVLIVVAGMEGALASVVAGLIDRPVIAVPTSVGYGASFGGVAPLLTMLNSCAPGIGVVNIDNGFGAAILAGQVLRTVSRLTAKF